MERLLAGFSALGWREYLFAAGMAYVLTYIYRVFQRRKESGKNKEKTYVIQTFDKRAIDRCKELFPIDVLSFKGQGIQKRDADSDYNNTAECDCWGIYRAESRQSGLYQNRQ